MSKRPAAPATSPPSKRLAQWSSPSRVYLSVPFSEKAWAKGAGAQFDWDRKKWYIEQNKVAMMSKIPQFRKWLPPNAVAAAAAAMASAPAAATCSVATSTAAETIEEEASGAMTEAAALGMPEQLRQLFVMQLKWNRPKNAQTLWDEHKKAMGADLESEAATIKILDQALGYWGKKLSDYVAA